MNLNYTCICYYCAAIYQANRSTSKYCCPSHNSLYNANGPQYNKSVLNSHGVYKDYHDFFRGLYNWPSGDNTWSEEYPLYLMVGNFSYDGPLPTGTELLLVSGFLLRKLTMVPAFREFITIKPMQLLTKDEKATCNILKGGYYFADEEDR